MNCNDFEARLESMLEQPWAPRQNANARHLEDPELRSHLAGCPACHELWEANRLLDEAVTAWRVAPPSVEMADRILFALAQEPPAVPLPKAVAAHPVAQPAKNSTPATPVRRHGRRHAAPITLAVAMSGLAALVLLSVDWREPVADPAAVANLPNPPASVVVPVEPPSLKALAEPDVPVEELVRSAGSAYLALAQRAANVFEDATTGVIPAPTIPDPQQPLPEKSAPAWLQKVGDGLTPWQNRLGNTLDQWLDDSPAAKG